MPPTPTPAPSLMRPLCVLVFALSATLAQAQNPNIEQVGAAGQANLNALGTGAAAPVYMGRTDGVSGNPYVVARWLQARLVTSNQVPLAPVPLKYDVLNQRLLLRRVGSPDSLLLDDRLLTGFVLEEPATATAPARERVFRRFTEAPVPTQRAQYVEVLHEGKYIFLKQHRKVVQKAPVTSGYGVDTKTAELQDQNLYFVRRPNGQLLPVKLTSKSLLAAAPELAPLVKAAAPRTDEEWAAAFRKADPR